MTLRPSFRVAFVKLKPLFVLLAVACALGACNEKPNPTNAPTTTATTATTATSALTPDATLVDPTSQPPTTLNAAPTLNPPTQKPPMLGGGCAYKDTLGAATITAISDPTPNQNACPKAAKAVAFSFTPDGAQAPTFTDRHLTIGDGKHPPEACLEPLGIKVGAVFPGVTLKEATAGTCSPIVFVWPEGFLKPCADACF